MEDEKVPNHSFDELVAKSVEVLDLRPRGTSEAIALTGIGYALLAYATAIREKSALPDEVPKA